MRAPLSKKSRPGHPGTHGPASPTGAPGWALGEVSPSHSPCASTASSGPSADACHHPSLNCLPAQLQPPPGPQPLCRRTLHSSPPPPQHQVQTPRCPPFLLEERSLQPPSPGSSPKWLAFPQPPPNLSNVAALPWQLWANTIHVTSCGKPSQIPRPALPCPPIVLSEPLCTLHVTALIRLPRMAVRRRHKTEPFQGRDGVPLIHLFSRGGGMVLSWGQRNAYWFIHSFRKPFQAFLLGQALLGTGSLCPSEQEAFSLRPTGDNFPSSPLEKSRQPKLSSSKGKCL